MKNLLHGFSKIFFNLDGTNLLRSHNLTLDSTYPFLLSINSKFIKHFKFVVINIYTFPFRSGSQRYYWEVLRIANIASCSKGGKSRSCASTRERCQGYSNSSFRLGDVVTSSLQYLPITVFGDVYLCDIWNVVLHARER